MNCNQWVFCLGISCYYPRQSKEFHSLVFYLSICPNSRSQILQNRRHSMKCNQLGFCLGISGYLPASRSISVGLPIFRFAVFRDYLFIGVGNYSTNRYVFHRVSTFCSILKSYIKDTVRPWDARFWGNGKTRVAQNSCNLTYLIKQRQEHQKTVQLKVFTT